MPKWYDIDFETKLDSIIMDLDSISKEVKDNQKAKYRLMLAAKLISDTKVEIRNK